MPQPSAGQLSILREKTDECAARLAAAGYTQSRSGEFFEYCALHSTQPNPESN
jgi:hypothetical protein